MGDAYVEPPPAKVTVCSGGQQAYCECPAGKPTRGGGGGLKIDFEAEVEAQHEGEQVDVDEAEITSQYEDTASMASKHKQD